LALPGFAEPSATDKPSVGQTWIVACRQLPMHAEPTGFSRPVAKLDFKDEVEIEELTGKYELPDSQQDKHANSDSDGFGFASGSSEHFAWARVRAGAASGYVPLSCLVNGMLINGPYEDPAKFKVRQAKLELPGGGSGPESAVSSRGFSKKEKGDKVAMRGMSAGGVQECTAEQVQANASAPESAVSSRGFSKKEKGDKVAMRGMSSGGDVCVKEDYPGLEKHLATLPFVADPYNADLAFRREGGLGEFK